MDEETIVESFKAGSDAYWCGDVPDGWDDTEQRMTNPYLMGWFLESQADNGLDLDLRG